MAGGGVGGVDVGVPGLLMRDAPTVSADKRRPETVWVSPLNVVVGGTLPGDAPTGSAGMKRPEMAWVLPM